VPKYGLAVFPSIYDSFYGKEKRLLLAQRLEPSILYTVPVNGESVFLKDNEPRPDVALYLCSVFTRGWQEFKEFSVRVGREKIVAGGYHPTALPQDVLPYARKVITGYCGNVDDVLDGPDGICSGKLTFTPMRRGLIEQRDLRQVYPDVRDYDIIGSMVSSVGCPFACDFCSTPNMSGRKMTHAQLEYVEREIADLQRRGVSVVFVRDESFATNRNIKEIAQLFKGKFRMVYSFGTGNVMAQREDIVRGLAECGWHSFNFGLEDVGTQYRKNKLLKQATENCNKYGVQYPLSFIVNDDKPKDEAAENYRQLYKAFCDLKPSQVCANFLMPMPGSGLWERYKGRIKESDFEKYDSKTPLLCDPSLVEWHKRMIVLVQVAYYFSEHYPRNFCCGDVLHRRVTELAEEYNINDCDFDEVKEKH
jgi:radical SAM superfamily enzyme YgiQ (UPF0313 family)